MHIFTTFKIRFLNKLALMWSDFPGILHPVLDCLDKFRLVVEGCFSWALSPDFKERIEDFSQNYADLMTYAEVSLFMSFVDKLHFL